VPLTPTWNAPSLRKSRLAIWAADDDCDALLNRDAPRLHSRGRAPPHEIGDDAFAVRRMSPWPGPPRVMLYVAQAFMPGSASRLSPPPRVASRGRRRRPRDAKREKRALDERIPRHQCLGYVKEKPLRYGEGEALRSASHEQPASSERARPGAARRLQSDATAFELAPHCRAPLGLSDIRAGSNSQGSALG